MSEFTKKFRIALAVLASLVQASSLANVAFAQSVTIQPSATPDVTPYINLPAQEPNLTKPQITQLLQQKIKYVFVIFNENQSFDNEYGTFPGVNGIYSDGQNPRSASNTPGYTQTYVDNTGMTITVHPFLIGPQQNASAVDSVDHSHTGLATKIHLVNGVAQMDKFAYDEYNRFASKGGAANISEGKQYANLVMSHIDCNTLPVFWNWASHFTIFDNIYATEDTPSAPNAIAMIAGQSGETQWVKHGNSGQSETVSSAVTDGKSHSGTTQGPPIVNDPQPFYGSQYDTTPAGSNRAPFNLRDGYSDSNIASILTFASLPLTFQGTNIKTVLASNLNISSDLHDIQNDIPYIKSFGSTPVNWRWYQEGYDLEPTDTNAVASHTAYVSHHNGAQYFGYVADTPVPSLSGSLKGLNDLFNDLSNGTLSSSRGVFYIRGGYTNQQGLTPPITNPNTPAAEITAINAAKSGDDDHPSYSDRQISQAMAARVVNLIAKNPTLWSQSAIILTYDESDGHYDHVPPRILSYGPDSLPLSRGIRIPLIVISPYARAHTASHVEGDHNAVIQTINAIFGLPALASLPDEAAALTAGNSAKFNAFAPAGFQQKYLGPRDINSSITDSLLSAFDPQRLLGTSPLLPASLATIPSSDLTLPLYNGQGCTGIGVIPVADPNNIPVPTGFNPLPGTYSTANP